MYFRMAYIKVVKEEKIMSLMVVGADNLGSIKSNIESLGFDDIKHISGRKKSVFRSFKLPVNVDMVLVLTDYIHHSAMKKVKQEAKEKDVNVIFSRRSWASIYKKMERRQLLN